VAKVLPSCDTGNPLDLARRRTLCSNLFNSATAAYMYPSSV
jgi:hypothetical protein